MAVVENSVVTVGFEAEFMEKLRELVGTLPKGTAELYIGHVPAHPKSLPFFRITPTNHQAAIIQGGVCDGQGIDFKIGQATGGEIFVSPKRTDRDNARVERFFQICRSVFSSNFCEVLILNSSGSKVWSRITLKVDGRRVRLGGGWIFWWLVPRKTKRVVCYEPYR